MTSFIFLFIKFLQLLTNEKKNSVWSNNPLFDKPHKAFQAGSTIKIIKFKNNISLK